MTSTRGYVHRDLPFAARGRGSRDFPPSPRQLYSFIEGKKLRIRNLKKQAAAGGGGDDDFAASDEEEDSHRSSKKKDSDFDPYLNRVKVRPCWLYHVLSFPSAGRGTSLPILLAGAP